MKSFVENNVTYFKMMEDTEYYPLIPNFRISDSVYDDNHQQLIFNTERDLKLYLETDFYTNGKYFNPFLEHLEISTLDCLINDIFCEITLTFFSPENCYHSHVEFHFNYHN